MYTVALLSQEHHQLVVRPADWLSDLRVPADHLVRGDQRAAVHDRRGLVESRRHEDLRAGAVDQVRDTKIAGKQRRFWGFQQ